MTRLRSFKEQIFIEHLESEGISGVETESVSRCSESSVEDTATSPQNRVLRAKRKQTER